MKSGILIINKDKNMTSRDVVNEVCKKLGTKKVGHTGTLDPIATGVLVVCVNEGTKIIEYITSDEKEYIAEAQLGINTDTLDITGNILNEDKNVNISKDQLNETLNSFLGTYMQEVPSYSAVRVAGKRLYEYARNNINVELPKRMVEIKNIELLSLSDKKFTFKVKVSKGTYIRSLIRDIGIKLNTYAVMTELKRTQQGIFKIKDSVKLKDINYDNLISINDALKNYESMQVDETIAKKIKNGCKIEGHTNDLIRIVDSCNNLLALYKNDSNINLLRAAKVFNNDK